MPLIKLQVTEALPVDKKEEVLKGISALIAECIGKPEQYVMAVLEQVDILMSGSDGPGAFADVRSIGGLGGSVNQEISSKLCDLLESELSIQANRIYINFTDVPASQWGWNGSTFG